MRKHILAVAVAMGFVLSAAVVAQAAKAKSAPKIVKAAVIMPAADLKWADLDPNTPGVKSADVWGDHTKGAYGGFTKFPAGFTAPLHTHSHDMKIVVISGTFLHTPEGKGEIKLGPGSYLMQPAHYRHTTGCGKESECLFFIQSDGKFDLKPVEAGTAPAKK